VIVLDSSAAIRATLPQKDRALFQSIIQTEICSSPSLFLSETSNVLWKEVQFNALPINIARELQEIIHGMTEIIPDDTLITQALTIALSDNHSVYDCLFIALSRELKAPILTADKKLKQKFSNDNFIDI